MKRFFGLLALAVTLGTPPVMFGAEHRYYDRDHKDYHRWNEAERRAYRHWLLEERREREYRDYTRIGPDRQREYWRWRHEHGDWH
jgi:hypothetical protein